MAYASRAGRARVSSSSPQAFAVCQRCGFWYNRVELANQYEWQGAALLPRWVFVCPCCYDTPQQNGNRAFVPPADPVPIQLPFPEDFSVANSVMGLATDGSVDPITNIPLSPTIAMQTVDGVLMTPTPVGRPPGYTALDRAPFTPNEVVNFMAQSGGVFMAQSDGTYMATEQAGSSTPASPVPPLQNDENNVQYGAPLPIVSLLADGTPLVRATCNGPHGLALNSQIAVMGSMNALADGIFSVIPITATAFTYGTYSPVDAGSILGPDTRIVTVLIGLPRDYAQVPQTGPAYSQHTPTKTSQ